MKEGTGKRRKGWKGIRCHIGTSFFPFPALMNMVEVGKWYSQIQTGKCELL